MNQMMKGFVGEMEKSADVEKDAFLGRLFSFGRGVSSSFRATGRAVKAKRGLMERGRMAWQSGGRASTRFGEARAAGKVPTPKAPPKAEAAPTTPKAGPAPKKAKKKRSPFMTGAALVGGGAMGGYLLARTPEARAAQTGGRYRPSGYYQ